MLSRLAASPLDFVLAATPRALCAPTLACSQAKYSGIAIPNYDMLIKKC